MSEFKASDLKVHVLGFWSNSWAGPTTSFAVAAGNQIILLDVGVDPVGQLRLCGLSPDRVHSVFLSHCHSDHISGFANFVFTRSALLKRSEDAAPQLLVFGHSDVLATAQEILRLQYPERSFDIDWREASSTETLRLTDVISASFVSSDHTVPGLCCRIDVGTTRAVGFQSDSRPDISYVSFFQGVEVLIAQVFSMNGDKETVDSTHKRGHSTLSDAVYLSEAARAGVVIPFHLPDSLHRDAERELLTSAFSAAGLDVVLPTAGLAVSPRP